MRKITTLCLLLGLALTGLMAQKYALVYQGYPYKKTLCDDPTYAIGEKVTVSPFVPEKEGKVFSHWEFEGRKFSPAQTFTMPAKDVVLVPVWESGTAVEPIDAAHPDGAKKFLENGFFFIINNGVKYTIMGEQVQ
jgi:hypothetical protein